MTSQVMAVVPSEQYRRGMTVATGTEVGQMLRSWRDRRRMSQLQVATTAAISTRHLSFVETGRAKPSREMVLHLAETLDVPFRERNSLLLSAGFAPAFHDVGYDAPELQPVRNVLDVILKGHEPHPALVVDAHWNVVAMNDAALMFAEGVAPELLEPPMNVMRVSLHPEGLAPRIVNLAEFSGHVIHRLRRQAELTGDPGAAALLEEMLTLVADSGSVDAHPRSADTAGAMVLPLEIASEHGVLSFVSTITTFGAPMDVVTSELAIEAFHPADAFTAETLGSRWA